jgi:hypothetical protein
MRINDLGKKNHELEKFKFVLDYKITELRLHLEPKKNEIIYKRNKIYELGLELVDYGHSVVGYNIEYENLLMKIHTAIISLYKETWKYEQQSIALTKIKSALTEAMKSKSSPNELKRVCVRMYQDLKNIPEMAPSAIPDEVVPKLTKQKLYVELEKIAKKDVNDKESFCQIKSSSEENYRCKMEGTIRIIKQNCEKTVIQNNSSRKKLVKESELLLWYD